MKTLAFIFFVSFMAVAAARATDASSPGRDDDVEQNIREVLSQRSPQDTPEWWRSLGPQAPGVIIRMFNNDHNIYEKVRLLEALQWFDDSQAVDFLKQQAQTSSNTVLRDTALRALGHSQGKKSENFLKSYLHDPDPRTRLAAAETLQDLHTSHADMIVSDYLENEKSAWIVDRVKSRSAPHRKKVIRRSE